MSENNPLLAPIHGISLYDYSAANARLANNVPVDAVCKALGIEIPVWEDASNQWVQRMQADPDFVIAMQMGTYFSQADQHPKLGALKPEGGAAGNEYFTRISSDRYFYEELAAAREAAYEAGLDGAQWMLDEFGIALGDFQQVAMQWMESSRGEDYEITRDYLDYHQEKKAEYAERFAGEQGGNIADDIDF